MLRLFPLNAVLSWVSSFFSYHPFCLLKLLLLYNQGFSETYFSSVFLSMWFYPSSGFKLISLCMVPPNTYTIWTSFLSSHGAHSCSCLPHTSNRLTLNQLEKVPCSPMVMPCCQTSLPLPWHLHVQWILYATAKIIPNTALPLNLHWLLFIYQEKFTFLSLPFLPIFNMIPVDDYRIFTCLLGFCKVEFFLYLL